MSNQYFLPYQLRWLADESPIKIWEKSRRIGATYVQSYEDVRDCVSKKVPAVWFSSADESAAREYIAYCEQWTKLFNMAAKPLGQVVIDSEKDIKAFVIEFANGTKIHALSSNPKGFRSKGGKVVLDEFAHHDSQDDLWKAARPCITWGFPLRILSTHNGKNCRYYKFVEETQRGKLSWSLHTTPIQLAVAEGLVDKILGKVASEEEKEAWLDEQQSNCFDENTWQQEYCCIAIDEATAFLTYELIHSCELDNLLFSELSGISGDLFVGMDIGRKKDLSVIWLLEKLGNVKYTRKVIELEKTPFHLQEEILSSVLKHKTLRRCCIDATGLGMQLAESAQRNFGQYRVEPITFTAKAKEELAYNLRTNFEDKTIYIPSDNTLREDLHSVRKVTTISGNIRFDVANTEAAGHADRFWALALALYAAHTNAGPIYVTSRQKRETYDTTKYY
jgi:phage FluMu gp28-like protein